MFQALAVIAATTIALASPVAAGTSGAPPAGAEAHPPFEPLLAITDPTALALLEKEGLDAGTLAFARPGARSVAELASSSPGWKSIVDRLRADVGEIYAGDSRYGVGMRHTHRGFDLGWLASPAVRLDLVAVVNRIDRRVFHPGTCGELRFVYRLGYTTAGGTGATPFSSRLPFTVNVVFFIPDDGQRCAAPVRALAKPADVSALVRAGVTLKAVEINAQTSRWPSTVRPDLGGHADYLLRVFHRRRDSDSYVAAPLENTPDADRIARDPKLQRALAAWLRQPGVLARIDEGTALLPEELAATRALSVTPRGLARRQNAPFRRLLGAADLGDLPLAGTKHVASKAALLRRLDALSCGGCHQSRSLAGFHVVGAERDPARTVDAIAVALSPHLEEDLPRRRAYLQALAAGTTPSEARPPAERGSAAGATAGTTGHACGLGDPGFSAWTCAPGYTCAAVDDDLVGQCTPAAPLAGAACRPGAVGFASDRIASAATVSCGEDRICENVRVGFPGGMCASDCAHLAPGEACGAIALLTPFNDCLARGGLFSTCARHARPAGLQRCDAQHPCRPDYLCSRASAADNVCLPPYFVLQMRVDGHPLKP